MKKNKIVLGMTFLSTIGVANAGFVAVIGLESASLGGGTAPLTPYGWYEFFEDDCETGGSQSLADLSAWESASSVITCNGSSLNIANKNELTSIANGLTIGSTSKYYNTESILSFDNLDSLLNAGMDLYLEGEGVSFSNLDSSGGYTTIFMNETGLKTITLKGVDGAPVQIEGDSVNRSNVDKIILDSAMYGYSYSPVRIDYVKNVDIESTTDSMDSMSFIGDSNVKNLRIEKSADMDNLLGSDYYAHFRLTDSSFENISLTGVEGAYLDHKYQKTRTNPDSFYDVDSIIFDESSLNYVELRDFTKVGKVEFKNAIVDSYFKMTGGDEITDGLYITNDDALRFGDGFFFELSDFDEINKVHISDVDDDSGSLAIKANNEIQDVKFDEVKISFMEIHATTLKNFVWTKTDDVDASGESIYFNGTSENLTFNQSQLPYISADDIGVINFNGIKTNSMMSIQGRLGELNLVTSTDFSSFSATIDELVSINVTNNNPLGGEIKLYLDAASTSSAAIFKDLDYTKIYFEDKTDLIQPLTDKINNVDIFCSNYGVSTFVYNRSQTLYSKTEICN